MEPCRRFSLLFCAGLLALASLSGCGSSTTTETIPSSATILYAHSVIFRNQSTMTMGYNGFGQLGNGTLTSRSTAEIVPGLGRMQKGVAGAEHTMVFGNNSSVMTWGYNFYGQLGNGASGSNTFSSSPVKVPLHALVDDIAAGGFHSLAVAGGVINAWGYNVYGQVGNGTATNAPTPVKIETDIDDAPLGAASQVAAGGTHSVALVNGSVYTWGNNASGQLGFNNFSAANLSIKKPRKVLSLPSTGGQVEQIAAMGRSTLALEVVRDGTGNITGQTLWGWGYNGTGELGKDPATLPTSYQPVPVFSTVTAADPIVIKKIATGLNHLLLLLGLESTKNVSDGSWTVQALGFNFFGQLGNDTTVNSFTLVETLMTSTPRVVLTGVTDIAAFGNHSLALINGAWYGWGNNNMGQLGSPPPASSAGNPKIPQLVLGF